MVSIENIFLTILIGIVILNASFAPFVQFKMATKTQDGRQNRRYSLVSYNIKLYFFIHFHLLVTAGLTGLQCEYGADLRVMLP